MNRPDLENIENRYKRVSEGKEFADDITLAGHLMNLIDYALYLEDVIEQFADEVSHHARGETRALERIAELESALEPFASMRVFTQDKFGMDVQRAAEVLNRKGTK